MSEISVYIGKIYNGKKNRSNKKYIVFDLDRTLGDFSELYILWKGITLFINNKDIDYYQNIFNELLDLYPEFLRCGIINILEFIKNKKKRNKLKGLYVYTNNKCSDDNWIHYIIKYFDYKLNDSNLFDKIICAFKINNKIIDINKHNKNLNFLINCTMMPKNTEICFIDNTYYNEMLDDNVYYIQPLSYNHNLNKNIIINRFLKSYIGNSLINEMKSCNFKLFLNDWFEMNKYNRIKQKISTEECIEITKKILYHIKEFFYVSNNTKTKKNLKFKSNFTRKMFKY
tara:strand:+ start:1117 stop:1971 length:855 start_codon:yes stop_codon:yes gene_type:complete